MIEIYIVNILKGLLFLSILYITYLIAEKIINYSNKKFHEARCEDKSIHKTRSISLNKYLDNEKTQTHFEKIEARLLKYGNPFKLTPIKYYFVKYGFTLLVGIAGAFNRWNIIIWLGFIVLAFFIIDILHWYSNIDDIKKICKDLPTICDTLVIQTSANVDLGIALTEISDLPRSERLKKDLAELAAEINLSKNPEKALLNFSKKYDFVQMDSFIQSINQSLTTGKSKEILNNLSESLKDNDIFSIQEETRNMDIKVGLIITILFIGTVSLVILCFSTQLQSGIQNIFN